MRNQLRNLEIEESHPPIGPVAKKREPRRFPKEKRDRSKRPFSPSYVFINAPDAPN